MGARLPIELEALKKHAIVIGASGSGKTVAAKNILEELVLNGVKVIAIDPQGDIASMALPSDDRAWKHARIRTRVFTPASDAGSPLSLNPLTVPPDTKNAGRMLAAVAENIAGVIGYDTRKSAGKAAVAALDKVLISAREPIADIDGLIDAIERCRAITPAGVPSDEHATYVKALTKYERELGWWTCQKDVGFRVGKRPAKPSKPRSRPEKVENKLRRLISDGGLEELTRRLAQLASGSKRELYCQGYPISVPELTRSPLSIVYLNSLYAPEEKMAVVAQIATNLYGWMLTHPSPSLQIVLYIDEIAQFLPAGTRNTAAKEALRLLFKQGRKYGIGVILATQNPGDADYRAMSQASTWLIGRLTMKQDLNKLRPLYNGIPATGLRNSSSGELGAEVINDLPHADVGQFQIISPDTFQGVRVFRFPMCRTPHKTLNETDIAQIN